MSRAAHLTSREGFTLLEILVAVLLMALLLPMVAEMCRTIGMTVNDLNDRSRAFTEAAMALDALKADLGGATALQAVDGELLLRVHASPPAPGAVAVRYWLDEDGRLQRTDESTGFDIVVSRDVEVFPPLQVNSRTVQIRLAVHRGTLRREALMMGSVP